MPAIILNNVTVSYGATVALHAVSVTIPQGVICAIVGPNGAGKSTLLKSLLGLIQPSSGTLNINGESPIPARRFVAYVPQRAAIDWDFPICVYEVVMMGRYPMMGFFKRPQSIDHARVSQALKQVGMYAHKDRLIGALSGGQQQRVFLARALVSDASVYILDEPFAGIDAATEAIFMDLFATLRAQGSTIIMVHHDLNTLESYADWLILLNRTVIATGTVEDVFTLPLIAKTYGRSIQPLALGKKL